MLLLYDSMKRKDKARKNTTENKLSLGRVSLDRMKQAADKGCEKQSLMKERGERLAMG